MDIIKEAFQRAKADILRLQEQLSALKEEIAELKETFQHLASDQQTNKHENPTRETSEYRLLSSNNQFSTGNRGVPTNKQTNKQTNQHSSNEEPNRITQVAAAIESLSSFHHELKNQIKQLTKQEMAVYSSIYQLESEGFAVDYLLLASRLKLSEISIRDYIFKIIKKNLPLNKQKSHNKKVILSIPKELKTAVSLSALLNLREN